MELSHEQLTLITKISFDEDIEKAKKNPFLMRKYCLNHKVEKERIVKNEELSKLRLCPDGKGIKNVVLMIAMINICNNKSSIGKRNVFTKEQIFEQTIFSLKTVRTKIPDSYIVYVEGSSIDEKMEKEIIDNVDVYINLSNDKQLCNFFTECFDKAMGDGYLLMKGLYYILNCGMKFERFYKIPQRYYLDDKFDIKEYTKTPIVTMKSKIKGGGYGNTIIGGIISCDYNNLNNLYSIYRDSLFYTILGYSFTIDHALYDNFMLYSDVFSSPKYMGYSGYNSSNGKLVRSGFEID